MTNVRKKSDITDLLARYPKMIVVQGGKIRGPFDITHEGRVCDTYEIEIDIPKQYPNKAPRVAEVGGRIERIADRHIFTDTGSFCLGIPEDELLIWDPVRSTLASFMAGPVMSFLSCQSLYEEVGRWPEKQRRHGLGGRLEFYIDLITPASKEELIGFLRFMANRGVAFDIPCPCGEGLRAGKCHKAKIIQLRSKVRQELAADFLSRLLNALNQKRT